MTNDPHILMEIEYKGCKIAKTPAGYKAIIGRNMELPGIFLREFLAEMAIDQHLGRKSAAKRTRQNGTSTD
jgi:hypothetical protein